MIRLLSTQLPTWSTGGMPSASQTDRRPGPGHGGCLGHHLTGLPVRDGGAPGHEDQDVVLDETTGELDVLEVQGKLRVVAADDGHGAADRAGRDGVDQRLGRPAQGSENGLDREAAHHLDRLAGNANALVVAIGIGLDGHADDPLRRSRHRARARTRRASPR